MDKEFEYKIHDNLENALERFDFVKAGNIMDFLGWCWYGNNYPPTYEEILKMIRELFKSAARDFENEYICCGSGGFSVIIYKNGKVAIQFIPVQSYSYD